MKVNIKASDLTIGKEQLEGSLSMLVKKPVLFLSKKPLTWLPFIYEIDFFGLNRGFLAIGETKEGEKMFSKERAKGKGKDEKGKIVKIDKKKVAYGRVRINEEGVYEFLLEGGVMKRAQAKKVIKSIGILKKTIGDNFAIISTVPVEGEKANTEEKVNTEEKANTAGGQQEKIKQKKGALRGQKYKKIEGNLPKLENAVGVVDEEKVQANIKKYEKVLADLIIEAKEDNVITKEEQSQIDKIEQKLAGMKAHLSRLDGRKIKLTPKKRAKVAAKIDEIDKRVREMVQMWESSNKS